MKILTKIFLVLAFLLTTCAVLLSIGIHGNKDLYNRLADIEESAIQADLDDLRKSSQSGGYYRAETARLVAKEELYRQVNRARSETLGSSADNLTAIQALVKKTYDAQSKVIAELATSTVASDAVAATKELEARATALITKRKEVDGQVKKRVLELQQLRGDHILDIEDYRAKEFNLYIMNKTLEARTEELARFRYTSPRLQKEVGDNGARVSGARVLRVDNGEIVLNRGSEDGVSMYQYFNVVRRNRTIGQIRITNVANRKAFARAESGAPMIRPGDVVVRRNLTNNGHAGSTSLGGK